VELEDEEVVEEDVDGCTDEENKERGVKKALRLYEAFACLEEGVAWRPDDEDAEKLAGQDREVFLGHERREDEAGTQPDGADGDCHE